MRHIICHIYVGGTIRWEDMGAFSAEEKTGLTISFPFNGYQSEKAAATSVGELIKMNAIDWLEYSGGRWLFRSDLFKLAFESFNANTWLDGDMLLDMEYVLRKDKGFSNTRQDHVIAQFTITPALIGDQMPKKIFLSHRSLDKPIVRTYHRALTIAGLEPWLDENDLSAGDDLERSLLKGMSDSCAAVFFITPSFIDDNFLATEVDYAIAEKRKKGQRFSIITLALPADGKPDIKIPPLLEKYVWKSPKSDLEGYSEIIRALPLKIGLPTWK